MHTMLLFIYTYFNKIITSAFTFFCYRFKISEQISVVCCFTAKFTNVVVLTKIFLLFIHLNNQQTLGVGPKLGRRLVFAGYCEFIHHFNNVCIYKFILYKAKVLIRQIIFLNFKLSINIILYDVVWNYILLTF